MIWNPWKKAAIAQQQVDSYREELLAAYEEIDYLESVLGKIVDKSVGYVNPTILRMADMAQEALSHDY
jgi:hypothetical protein